MAMVYSCNVVVLMNTGGFFWFVADSLIEGYQDINILKHQEKHNALSRYHASTLLKRTSLDIKVKCLLCVQM